MICKHILLITFLSKPELYFANGSKGKHSPNLQGLSLTIRLFNVISGTLIGGPGQKRPSSNCNEVTPHSPELEPHHWMQFSVIHKTHFSRETLCINMGLSTVDTTLLLEPVPILIHIYDNLLS